MVLRWTIPSSIPSLIVLLAGALLVPTTSVVAGVEEEEEGHTVNTGDERPKGLSVEAECCEQPPKWWWGEDSAKARWTVSRSERNRLRRVADLDRASASLWHTSIVGAIAEAEEAGCSKEEGEHGTYAMHVNSNDGAAGAPPLTPPPPDRPVLVERLGACLQTLLKLEAAALQACSLAPASATCAAAKRDLKRRVARCTAIQTISMNSKRSSSEHSVGGNNADETPPPPPPPRPPHMGEPLFDRYADCGSIDVGELTADLFMETYARANQPVVIKGTMLVFEPWILPRQG
jgi:hypothetical protein